MTTDDNQSLSDGATFAGQAERRPATQVSLGDERTLGGDAASGLDTVVDDIEVVDLESRYRLEGPLGQGGMGAVVLATDTRLDRKVAIKRILGEAARNRIAVQRFLTEAKAIAALNHANVVQIYDYGQTKDGPFLIMEYVDGGSLLDRCRGNALPLEEAIDLACQLCDGLAKAHDFGIIHRDIKPANVLLTKDGTPKLTDFGLAKAGSGDHGQTMTGAVLGTPDFMPPEQRRDAAEVDHRSDLWSLAATVYQMATGRSPKIIRFDLLPAELAKVLGKALEDAKDARYQSAREFREALKIGLRSATPMTALPAAGEGQCPACGVQNDVSRRFCRGCGASLFAPCLECSQPMPIWEDICGTCGGKQTLLVEVKRAEMAAAQAKAEGLLGDFEFDRAAAIASTLRAQLNPRLTDVSGWAEQFLHDIDGCKHEQVNRAIAATREALAHEKAYDYTAGVRVLDSLPHAVRALPLPGIDLTAGALLNRLTEKLQQSKSLEATIRAAIKKRSLAGLLENVIALANLRPDRGDLAKLRKQLEQRHAALGLQRDALVRQARHEITSQDYAAALNVLSKVDDEVLDSEVHQLRADAQQKEGLVLAIRDRIKAGVVANDYRYLLPTIEEYLKLKPLTPELDKIRAEALAQEQQTARLKRLSRLAAAAAIVTIVLMWCGMAAWRATNERRAAAAEAARVQHAAALKAALEAGAWDDVLVLDPTNVGGLIGRAKAKLNQAPPDVAGAFSDLKTAEGLAKDSILVAAALADACAVRAAESASADHLEDAAQELARAERGDADALFIAEAKSSIAKGWIRRMAQASEAGDTEAVQAASMAAINAGADSAALCSLWRDYAATRIQSLDARGLAAACSEIAPLLGDRNLLRAEEMKWWLQFGNLGIDRADESAVLKAADTLADLQSCSKAKESRGIGPPTPSNTAWKAKEDIDCPALPENHPQSAAALWRLQAEACVGRMNATGLATASREGVKHGMLERDVADLWLRLGSLALEPPNQDLAIAQTAVAEAKEAGASQRDVAALTARALMADAVLTFARKNIEAAISTVTEAVLADPATAAKEMGWPKNGDLRIAAAASYRTRARQAFAANDWETATKLVAAAWVIDPDARTWVLEELSNHPGGLAAVPVGVSERLPPEVIASGSMLRNSIGIEMRLLPAGTFTMGQADGDADERPHRVTITRAFYIGLHEVTNAQWRQVMRSSKSDNQTQPVIGVNWDQATEFCRRLSAMPEEKKRQRVYRLPTEAEWEYACRAGMRTTSSFGDIALRAGEHGWFSRNSDVKPHPVGHKKPNAWGLFDMQGNAEEWCNDWYADYESGPVKDPLGPSRGKQRVLRGGSCHNIYCGFANRFAGFPSDEKDGEHGPGFRIALSPALAEPTETKKP